jgi:hypothetical protein
LAYSPDTHNAHSANDTEFKSIKKATNKIDFYPTTAAAAA